MAYGMMFLKMRIFDKTAVFITMSYYIIRDLAIFGLIFFLIVLGYGNAFYIITALEN
jgi:hypothetical protein